MRYPYEQAGWPSFRWHEPAVAVILTGRRHRQGRLPGRMEMLGFALKNETLLRSLTADVLKTSEIESE